MSEVVAAQNVIQEHSVLFKSCARCSGDRQVRRDFDGYYIACLSCGHVTYPEVTTQEVVRLLEWKFAS
ncbi:MAG: hypothetical protein FI707_12845 [SAR202 cluster bacterium]|jgi:translation initiation factor 2 beta subunit (eIF-2beta)/eIF-5|nr:hypothetical protein [Chloroflexota bacterium]MDP6422318.1 hypothetical protein [SAR202 cluster bacterium]HAL46147.1 hypothetical protein [Dehalococcoidia bacterium]MDP6663410.1 hypothetical protein [SAR202 cluster bacterium]MDP6801155.1 hypothetical protein [SAR202 cluster bacterium]